MQGLVVVHLRDHTGKADTPALSTTTRVATAKKPIILLGDKQHKPDKRPSLIPAAHAGIGGMRARPAWTVDAR